jgi:hypothetical protein
MNMKIHLLENGIMKNEAVKTAMKIGATMGGLIFLVLVMIPEFSLAHAITPILIVELMLIGLSYFISRG